MRTRPSKDRAEEVKQLLRTIKQWAPTRDDIEAVGLVGSWARYDAFADSDVDLVLITHDVSTYVEGSTWLEVFPGAVIARTQSWGALTERRLAFPSGLEVEMGITTAVWASTDPLDTGTAQVIRDGLYIIYDPKCLLTALAAITERNTNTM
jgi:Streptomycin adenylyltransferase